MKKMLHDLGRVLGYWGRIEAIVAAQLSPSVRSLQKADEFVCREPRVMDHVVSLFLDSLHKIGNPTAGAQGEDAQAYGCHNDIPLPMGQFSDMIASAFRLCLAQKKKQPLRFLDVGSGGGTKVLAASMCFDDCVGLEYEALPVETGNKMLSLVAPDKCKLIQGDGLTFDGYGDFDVIYFYRPLSVYEKMNEMEKRIVAQVKPGTILLIASGPLSPREELGDLYELSHHVYIAGLSDAEAMDLVARAELLGGMVPGHKRRVHKSLGYWKPLVEASQQNGYFI